MRQRHSTRLGFLVGVPIALMAVLAGPAWAEEPVSSRPAFKAAAPKGRPATDHVREVQQTLTTAGYDLGPIDGVMGPRTRAAIRQVAAAPAPHAPSLADTRMVRPGANTRTEAP
jgi:peptidoglycan hydrolase-like protein with peptidoglycan-binding domain